MNHFKKNFIYLRKKFGVTQDWLALHLDKSQSTIGGWGSGVSEPSIDIIVKISDIFGISIDYLLKVDIEKSNLITDADIDRFKRRGNLIGNPISNLNPRNIGDTPALPGTDPVMDWTVLKLLKNIDEKVEQVRDWALKQPNKKDQ